MNANGMQIQSICNNLKYHLDSCCFILKWVITPRFIKTFEELHYWSVMCNTLLLPLLVLILLVDLFFLLVHNLYLPQVLNNELKP